MSEGLPTLLRLADSYNPPAADYDSVEFWPEGEVDRCVAAGLLSPAEPARYLPCRECSEQPIEEVVFLADKSTGRRHGYIPCPVCGPVPIPLKRLQRWETDWDRFMEAVFGDVHRSGRREEVVPGRLWRLGTARWGTRDALSGRRDLPWNVFFARGLHRKDASRVLEGARLPTRSAVFVPSKRPDDPRIERLPPVIPLDSVVFWEGSALRFDHDYVVTQLAADSAASVRPRQPVPRRSRRAPGIETLTEAVKEHLRAARDHAIATRDRTGVPQLLKRPTQKLLAKQLGMHESQVSRCFRDEEASLLKHLWTAACDVEQVLAFRG